MTPLQGLIDGRYKYSLGRIMEKQILKLADSDNTVVALANLAKGVEIAPGVVTVEDVPMGHKVALERIEPGRPVLKYGFPIGVATRTIELGEHVHVHNTGYEKGLSFGLPQRAGLLGDIDVAALPATYGGYVRSDGRVGTRNVVVVAAISNCAASVVRQICRKFEGGGGAADDKRVKVVPLVYGDGCGVAVDGEAFKLLTRTLSGTIDHPNVAGVVLVGLGCETITIESVLALIPRISHLRQDDAIRSFYIQESGGFAGSVERGVGEVGQLLRGAESCRRSQVPVGSLCVALNCGGSDAFSALTANPALGVVSDLLVEQGGRAVLAELPECSGAEELLAARCLHEGDGERVRGLFQWWEEYAAQHGVELNDNLSAGNIRSGLTTIVEKSLGAVMKGGSAGLASVVEYGERVDVQGLSLMNTPGFDPVSMTGLLAGGATLGVFTTGRGSLYGSQLAPVVKVASNTAMYRRLQGDMDFNAGTVVEGEGLVEVAVRLYKLLVEVASGRECASEVHGVGSDEFVPWNPREIL